MIRYLRYLLIAAAIHTYLRYLLESQGESYYRRWLHLMLEEYEAEVEWRKRRGEAEVQP